MDLRFIRLSSAAARVQEKLYPGEPRDAEVIQVIALALADLMPVYWSDTGRELTAPELAQLPRLEGLAVSRRRFEAALDTFPLQALGNAASIAAEKSLGLSGWRQSSRS
jgi:hypothetical protein